MKHLLQQERDEKLCREYENGATLVELAAKYKMNKTTVRSAVIRAGGTMRPMGYRPTEGSPEQLAERNAAWRKEYEAGKSAGQIAVKYRVHHSTVERGVVKAGGTLRSRGRYRKT